MQLKSRLSATLSANEKFGVSGVTVRGYWWQAAAVNRETLTVRKAEFGIVHIFIGVRALKFDHGANTPRKRRVLLYRFLSRCTKSRDEKTRKRNWKRKDREKSHECSKTLEVSSFKSRIDASRLSKVWFDYQKANTKDTTKPGTTSPWFESAGGAAQPVEPYQQNLKCQHALEEEGTILKLAQRYACADWNFGSRFGQMMENWGGASKSHQLIAPRRK